ncbi:MAG: S1 RNA-binding domain-containing protein [Patescibacteria group bacterium]
MSDETTQNNQMESLLQDGDFFNIPALGDLISGKVLSTEGREVRVDIGGLTTGVVRARELFSESKLYSDLKEGDEVEATVIGLENENGEMELSFRYAGNKKSWEELKKTFKQGDLVKVKILDANKGGLLVQTQHLTGFLPVSQLAPENYPRVTGGDKQKILDKLKEFIGRSLMVKILDMNETDEKLIFSEKAVWESEQKSIISKIGVGDIAEGEVTALADFGAFIKFVPPGSEPDAALEGLVHISEIAWQRIDHPKDILKVGQTIKAEVIGIEGSKIFLSMKKLIGDPWQDVAKKYQIGDTVEGTILKINPFGFFVELDPEIHGLAHVSELSDEQIEDMSVLGKIGETRKFKIVSIEPDEHRLGLSIKALDEKKKDVAEVAETKEVEEVKEAAVNPEDIAPTEAEEEVDSNEVQEEAVVDIE